jgi:hypothetical protein
MTAAEEAQFIQLWNQGASYKAIAAALGGPLGTVASRSAALAAQGKITCVSRKVITPVNQHILAIASRSGGSKPCAGRSRKGRLQGLLDQHCDGVNECLRLSTPGADFMDIKMDEVRIIALLPLIK